MRVLAFTGRISILTSILFAVIPLFGFDRRGPGSTLQEEASRTTPGLRRHRMQSGLVVSTVTFAFVLLMGQDSFAQLLGVDGDRWRLRSRPGPYRLRHVAARRMPTASTVRAFHESLFQRASSLAGVRSAALVTDLPLERYERRTLTGENSVAASRSSTEHEPVVDIRSLRSDARHSTRRRQDVHRRRGRPGRGCGDRQPAIGATVLARADALGKRLKWGADVPQNQNAWLTIVGVVADVADNGLRLRARPSRIRAIQSVSRRRVEQRRGSCVIRT